MRQQDFDRRVQPTSHPKIALRQHADPRGDTVSEDVAEDIAKDIRSVVATLSQKGYRRLVAVSVDDGDARLTTCLQSVGFRRRPRMEVYERALRHASPSVTDLPPQILVSDFHGLAAQEVYPVVDAIFAERPIVGHRSEFQEIMENSGFLPDCSRVARDGDRMIGVQLVHRRAPTVVEFTYGGVTPEWRRRHVALSLLSHSLDACRAAGYRTVTGHVAIENAAGRGFLDRAGFSRVGSLSNCSLDLRGDARSPARA